MISNETIQFYYRLRLWGIVLALPALWISVLAVVTPITASGVFYLLGYWLIVIALIRAPQQSCRFLLRMGIIIVMLVASIRVIPVFERLPAVKIITLPSGKQASWLNFLIDEKDTVLFGEATLRFIGVVTEREHENIATALSGAYQKLSMTQRVFPSPIIRTYLGFQTSKAFDTIVIEPPIKAAIPTAIVFLHGSMGNVTIQCWQIAQAVSKIGASTICPSTHWEGDWWQPESAAILGATLDYVHARGIERLYLGGYSNGGNGISVLIPNLAKEHGLKGLFFIAGVHSGSIIKNTHLPVLVIQGIHDEKIPVEIIRLVIQEIGDLTTYIELEADHFLIMKQPQIIENALSTWLKKCELDDP